MDEADKVTAKLMSLADNWALSAGDSAVCGDESLPMQCETRAALEQAIRRAVASSLEAANKQEPLTDGYVQPVPDKCDRITWRGRYYHLPLAAAPSPGSGT